MKAPQVEATLTIGIGGVDAPESLGDELEVGEAGFFGGYDVWFPVAVEPDTNDVVVRSFPSTPHPAGTLAVRVRAVNAAGDRGPFSAWFELPFDAP